MKNFSKLLYACLIYFFFYAPIIILIIFSFNNATFSSLWHGFTWQWYQQLLNDSELQRVTLHSIILGVLAATISTLLGTLAAVSLYRYQFFGKKLLGNFGPSYLQVYPGLIIYTASSCLNSATIMWQSLLLYTDQTYHLLKSYVFSYLILMVAIGLACILHMDFSKIMIAYAIFQGVLFLGNAFYIWKKLRPIQLFPIPFFKAPV